MADYYMQFSTAVDRLTGVEKAWLQEFLARPSDDVLDGTTEDINRWLDHEGRRKVYDDTGEELEFWPHFQWDLRDSEWQFYSEENANIEFVMYVAKTFLKKFRPTDYIIVEVGYSCSRLRTDGFGGCAAFITARGSKFMSTSGWIEKQAIKFTKKSEDKSA